MLEMMFIIGVAIVLPLVSFLGIVGLAIFIWCWGRIGRYFINFARWLGSWRNFVPLSILGILGLISIVVIFPILGLPSMVMVIVLILFVLVTVVIFFFALIAWVGQFTGWFWPRWRKLVWSFLLSIWGGLPSRSGKGKRTASKPPARPASDRRPPVGKQQRSKGSWLSSFWGLMIGRPTQRAESVESPQPGAANVRPPKEEALAKRSWFSAFWALMLGKPQPKREQAKPTRVQTTEQTLSPPGNLAASARTESSVSDTASSAAPRARRSKPAKRSWFGTFWALMLGRPSKSAKAKPRPAKAQTTDQMSGSPDNVAATAKTGASTGVAKAATSPESDKVKPAKQGAFGRIWSSVVRGVTFAAGLVILGVLWVGRKIGEGIEWIRIRLNLD